MLLDQTLRNQFFLFEDNEDSEIPFEELGNDSFEHTDEEEEEDDDEDPIEKY
ncbi:MAG: hypothetical protein O3C23_01205 [bacterium]|nr:hypothetical protein [bacterium]